MTLIIDNYDSFTYNLAQAISAMGVETRVVRNDKIDVAGIEAMKPDYIVISPGPGNPDTAGVSLAAVRAFAGKVPILGVCLGHQTVAQAFGGRIVPAKTLMHGKTSRVRHDGKGIFAAIPQGFEAMRYHSLAVDGASLPDCLEVSATAEDGEIMALRHKTLAVESVQYHPESICTPEGARQLANFFGLAGSAPTPEETVAYREFTGILRGEYTERELGAMLTLDAEKQISPDRLFGAAKAMRDSMASIDLGCCDAVDIVGTGGDGRSTFNISTTAAFVAAGAGVKVAKHGNVAATSKCGAADVLRELGADLSLPPAAVRECFERTGVAFLFAQRYHSGMRFAANVRRYLGFKTLFNLLGPLTNPAGTKRQVIGVPNERTAMVFAETFRRLGSTRAMVVAGEGGLDEISPCGFTFVSSLEGGGVRNSLLDAGAALGERHAVADIKGADAATNARLLRGVLDGSVREGYRAAALENAAAVILVADRAANYQEALARAAESIDSGRAQAKLEAMLEAMR